MTTNLAKQKEKSGIPDFYLANSLSRSFIIL